MRNTTNPHRPAVLPIPTDEPVVSVERAGSILGISRATAYAAVNNGTIPSIRLGRRIVVPTAPLLRLVGLDGTVVGDAA